MENSLVKQSVNTLLARAQKGDSVATQALQRRFDTEPELWDGLGNMAKQAEQSLTRAIAGKDELSNEAIRRKAAQIRQDLVGPNPTASELLLVERIAVCWLHLYWVETSFAQNQESCQRSLTDINRHQKWIDRAQHRYLAAIKALAQVRRLLGPAVQVNVAGER